jgi:hypothetical protein
MCERLRLASAGDTGMIGAAAPATSAAALALSKIGESGVTVRSDDIVAMALRLLWQLDTFLAEVDANRLDDLPEADRVRLQAALGAMSTTINEIHPRRRAAPCKGAA